MFSPNEVIPPRKSTANERVLLASARQLPNKRDMGMRKFIAFTFVFASLAQAAAAQRTDKIILQGNLAGTQTVQTESTGTARAEYSYNDRGRGDHIIATWKLDAAGVPIEYEGHGNDYMKAPVEERFEMKNGKASWKNRSEQRRSGGNGRGVLSADESAPGILWECWRVRSSKRPATNWRCSLPAKRASRRPAKQASLRQGRIDRNTALRALAFRRNRSGSTTTARRRRPCRLVLGDVGVNTKRR